jgi:GNAT superfamily N-acetyltransferase
VTDRAQHSIEYRSDIEVPVEPVLELYRASNWSAAAQPTALIPALRNSHTLITAWDGARLAGLGNAISDGHLVVYYPHLIVAEEYRRQGIGRSIMNIMRDRYSGFHQQVLVADGDAVEFYHRCGFRRAGSTQPMWIYDGTDHD